MPRPAIRCDHSDLFRSRPSETIHTDHQHRSCPKPIPSPIIVTVTRLSPSALREPLLTTVTPRSIIGRLSTAFRGSVVALFSVTAANECHERLLINLVVLTDIDGTAASRDAVRVERLRFVQPYHTVSMVQYDRAGCDNSRTIRCGRLRTGTDSASHSPRWRWSLGSERRTFLRRLVNATGMTPSEYCRAVRIAKACEILQAGNMTLKKIA